MNKRKRLYHYNRAKDSIELASVNEKIAFASVLMESFLQHGSSVDYNVSLSRENLVLCKVLSRLIQVKTIFISEPST